MLAWICHWYTLMRWAWFIGVFMLVWCLGREVEAEEDEEVASAPTNYVMIA